MRLTLVQLQMNVRWVAICWLVARAPNQWKYQLICNTTMTQDYHRCVCYDSGYNIYGIIVVIDLIVVKISHNLTCSRSKAKGPKAVLPFNGMCYI
jgi:hypothetical protein